VAALIGLGIDDALKLERRVTEAVRHWHLIHLEERFDSWTRDRAAVQPQLVPSAGFSATENGAQPS